MDSKIIIRTSKNKLFKSRTYQIKLNDSEIRELNHEKNKTEFILPVGKYTVKIGNDDSFKNKDIILSTGQTKILTINPSITYGLGFGFLLGMALVSIIIQFIILEKISIPLMLIPFIPLIFMRKKHFADSFEITYSTL
jgi:hypothetical protein